MKKNYLISFVLLFSLQFTSCLKKQNLAETDLGPVVNNDSLQNKMSESIGALSFDELRKQEINIFTARSSIQDGAFRDRYKQELMVSDIQHTASDMTIDFLFNRIDYINSANNINSAGYRIIVNKEATDKTRSSEKSLKLESLKFEDQISFSKTALNKAAQSDTDAPKPLFLYRAYAYFAIQGCREDQVTCHNLKSDVRKIYLKPEQADPTICPDINNCLVDENKIEFDMLDRSIKTADGKPYRTHYTFLVSPQLPFLSKVIQYCARGLTKINDRMVLAEDCSSLNDFSYGQ